MNTQTLINRLAALPTEIAAAEARAHDLTMAAAHFKHQQKVREAQLITSGQIEGKNAEERSANLLLKVAPHLMELEEKDDNAAQARLALSALQTELSCLRSIVRLLVRETE